MNEAGWEDTVVWNPYGDEGMGYDNFVCVESGLEAGDQLVTEMLPQHQEALFEPGARGAGVRGHRHRSVALSSARASTSCGAGRRCGA